MKTGWILVWLCLGIATKVVAVTPAEPVELVDGASPFDPQSLLFDSDILAPVLVRFSADDFSALMQSWAEVAATGRPAAKAARLVSIRDEFPDAAFAMRQLFTPIELSRAGITKLGGEQAGAFATWFFAWTDDIRARVQRSAANPESVAVQLKAVQDELAALNKERTDLQDSIPWLSRGVSYVVVNLYGQFEGQRAAAYIRTGPDEQGKAKADLYKLQKKIRDRELEAFVLTAMAAAPAAP